MPFDIASTADQWDVVEVDDLGALVSDIYTQEWQADFKNEFEFGLDEVSV